MSEESEAKEPMKLNIISAHTTEKRIKPANVASIILTKSFINLYISIVFHKTYKINLIFSNNEILAGMIFAVFD